jgi:uncharacterized protein
VIAVDTNILIYANRAELPLHTVARTRLAELAEGAVPWGLPVVAAWGFARIVTQPIFDPPTPTGQAVEFIDHLLGSPTVRVLGPRFAALGAAQEDPRRRSGAGRVGARRRHRRAMP